MPRKEVFNLTIDVGANISQAQSAAKSLQQAFSKINLSDSLKKGLDKTFGDLEKELNNFSSMTSKPFTNMKDIEKAEKSYEKIVDLFHELSVQGKTISGMDPSKFLPKETIARINTLQDSLKKVRSSINDTNKDIVAQNKAWKDASQAQLNYQQKISDANSKLKSLQGSLGASTKKIKDLKEQQAELTQQQTDFLNNGGSKSDPQYQQWGRELQALQKEINGAISNQSSYQKQIAETKSQLNQYNNAEIEAGKAVTEHKQKLDQLQENLKNSEGLTQLREEIAKIQGVSLDEVSTDADELEKNIANLSKAELAKIVQELLQIGDTSNGLVEASGATKGLKEAVSGLAQQGGELNEVAKEVERLGEQAKQFFSIGNTIQLFKRAVRDAMNTVKELDATMTETATVTDFSISDMWEQLPRYTDEANKLGTSINSLYKATTLYYQQGLDTNEAMALGIETIKMARVANMDAAQATDLMTAALRGFNMELNETSAIRVNDVYSELAAVTAADTDEIGIAISKTASIAHSANMEFETTAAFLSQIIETTREAPETAGTAMKTIIARFSEVKKLYSEGQILGTDEEGEAINVNKIQEALRTVGIDMTKFFVGAEGLDDVLLRLAEKWDTLDVATQRYIATQAAGSRQQSRFLAMMSDYDRTMELVDAAYDSAGSGQAQFEKTLDSMQAKLTELKNAWDQFVMGLANNEILKFGVDTLTKILSTINDIISAISGKSGLVKSVLSLGSAFLALRGGAKLFGSGDKAGLLGKFFGILKGKSAEKQAKEASQKVAQSFSKGFKDFISSGLSGNGIRDAFKKNFQNIRQKFKDFFIKDAFNVDEINGVLSQIEGKDVSFDFGQQQGILGIEENRKKIEELGYTVKEVNGEFQILGKEATVNVRAIGIAVTALGGILMARGDQLEKEGDKMGIVYKTIGTAITGIGTAITLVGGSFTKAGIEIGKAGEIAKLGWAEFIPILLAIGAIIALITSAINNTPEKRLERAKQRAQEAQQAAQEAQQAYDDLLSNKNKYTELEDKIKSLTKGTEEWKEAVAELNGDVLKLAQNYKGIKFEYGEDGVLQVTNWDEVIKQSKKERDDALYTSLQSSAQETDIELEIARNNQLYKHKTSDVEPMSYSELDYQYGYGNISSPEERKKAIEKDWEPIIDEVTTSAEAKAKNSSRNILLAFMPDAAISNKITDEISDSIVEAYDKVGKKVSDLTQDELKEVLNKSTVLFSSFSEEVQNFLQGDFNEIDTAETFTFDENQIKRIAEAWKMDEDAVRDYIAAQNEAFNLSQEATKEELGRVTGSQSRANFLFERYGTGLSKTLADTTNEMGEEDGLKYLNAFGKIFEKDKSLDKAFSKKIAGLKINNINDLVSITDMLRNEGYSEKDIDEYWESYVKGANNFSLSLKDIANRADSLSEVYKSIDEIVKRMEEGSLTGEDIAYLEGLGVDLSGLQRTADGWRLIGDEAERAIAIMREQPLAQEQATVDYLDKIKQQGPEMMAKYLGLSMDDFLDPGEFYTEVQKRFAEIYNMATQNEAFTEATKYTADQNASQGGSAESVRYSAENDAKSAGLDKNELIAYSEKLKETYGLEQAIADRIALDNMKMNASIKELSSNWDEWKAGLESGKDTAEYSAALNNLRKNMQSMLGITSNLSEEFLTNAENMDLMAKAAEGDGDAIDELRKKAATELALGINYDEDGIDQVESNLLNALEGFDPNIEIGTTLEDANLTQAFQELIDKGYASADEVNKALEGIGFEPEITTEEIPINGSSAQRIVANGGFWKPTADMMGTEWVPIKNETELQGYVGQTATVPIINGQKTKYKGSPKSTVNGSNKKGSSGGKKGGGGGGGSSKKQNNWKNPYDKYYNLTEKINEALRTREKLERDHERILKRKERNISDILKNSEAEINNLKQEVKYQEQLQAGRREQIQNVGSEKYDDDGTLKTFEEMGVTKYAHYNFDTQTIEIDWAAIDNVRDERLGKAIEEYISRLEELEGQYEETQDTIEEMEDEIWEINQRGKNEYLELEQRVIDALINQQQKLIDDLSAKFDSINEANSRVLSSMQESIDLERQIRDNTKTEDDITSKEARLAYLRRDTSGANQMEIMKLEQDLADARQNYSDQLIDQGMQKLSDENERAAEQRQEQIDIMQAQLDHQVQNGEFNKQALFLLENAFTKDGNLDINSDLVTLLKGEDNFKALTEFGKENWWTQLHEAIAAGLEGSTNFAKEKYKDKNNTLAVTGANGKANIYWDKDKNAWVDTKGNTYGEINTLTGTYGSFTAAPSTPVDEEKENNTTPPPPSSPTDNSNNNNNNSNKNNSNKKSSAPKKYYKAQIKDGSKTLWTGRTKHSSTSAAEKEAKEYLGKMRRDKYNAWKNASSSEKEIFKQILAQWNRANASYKKYKTGGLANFTGPAWLDGTASHPELVLNARDTENFIQLKDILSDMGSLDKLQNGGDNYYNFDIKVDQLANDYDVDKLIGKIKNEIDKDARYRNVNSINFIR